MDINQHNAVIPMADYQELLAILNGNNDKIEQAVKEEAERNEKFKKALQDILLRFDYPVIDPMSVPEGLASILKAHDIHLKKVGGSSTRIGFEYKVS